MVERLTPHLQKVREIQGAILQTRRNFIGKYRRREMGSKALTYEPALDHEVYATLQKYEGIPESDAYTHAKHELNAYTELQVATFIGERLNVELSSFRYDLRGGKMYGQGRSDTVVDMIQLGRDCRDEVVKDIDKPRQDAEIVQFTRIQDEFTKKDTSGNLPEIGKTIISISPPGEEGSAYSHNFYDIFVLSEDQQTKERFVAAHRYASELSAEEYQAKADALVSGYMGNYTGGPLDSYFLSHPVVLDISSPLSNKPEEIHKDFHTGHEFLSVEDFSEVRRSIAGLIISYINTLVATPDDVSLLHLHLNAIMNKADNVAERIQHAVRRGEVYVPQEISKGPVSHREIMRLGQQPVRPVTTGCGSSGGFGQDRTPSNLSSFNTHTETTSLMKCVNCPFCGNTVDAILTSSKIECPDCHASVNRN